VRGPATRRDAPDEGRVVRILLVDDVLRLIELQKNYLKRTTCRILTARTGSQALQLCRRDPPDLVLLDAAMPEMDGISACRSLKADPVLGRIPIVIVTSADRREECLRAGCDDVLIKPFESTAFLEKVRRFVPLAERLESRIPVSCRVEFRARIGSYTAYTRDLSAHGMFLKSPRPFAVGRWSSIFPGHGAAGRLRSRRLFLSRGRSGGSSGRPPGAGFCPGSGSGSWIRLPRLSGSSKNSSRRAGRGKPPDARDRWIRRGGGCGGG